MDLLNGLFSLLPVLIFAVWILSMGVKILNEYERGVVFRLGRLVKIKGPGLVFIIPIVDRMSRVDLRTITLDVPSQEIITRDNVTVKVNAVCYFRVLDANKAVVSIQNFVVATSQIAQTSMRSVVGQSLLDELLSERDKLNRELQRIIDEQTDPWGVKVSIVEIKDVQIPENMQRAMAQAAEAERERRAKIIAAQGEFEASMKLAEAAEVLARQHGAMQLRYLQVAREMADSRAATFIFPIPMEMVSGLVKK